MIKSFDVASDTVLHGTHILKNVIGSNVFRVNHTSDIETVDHVIKGKAVYFCNQFGFGYGFGKKCKEYVFFVQVCKRDKGFCSYCKIHCYKPEYRAEMKKVMKYSGPRMLLPHPIFAMSHVTAMIKHKKQSGEKDKEQAND